MRQSSTFIPRLWFFLFPYLLRSLSPLSQISSPWMILPGFRFRIPVDLFPIYRSVVVSSGFGYGRDSSVSPPMIFRSGTISMLVLRSEKTLRDGRFSPFFSADLALSEQIGISINILWLL